MIVGIDIGISSTKIVALSGKKLLDVGLWDNGFSESRLDEYLSSLLDYCDKVDKIAVTGVGSKKLSDSMLGIPIVKVDEFDANAASVSYLHGYSECIVVSIGSGTSFVHVSEKGIEHIGGSALGGGTILGLFRQFDSNIGWRELISLAKRGSLEHVELTVKDVSDEALPGLPLDTSVTNFGKAITSLDSNDLALGLINLVLQNVGVMAYLAGNGRNIKTFVVIGRMTTLPHAKEIFSQLSKLYNVNFILAEQAVYMTAIGAALKCL